eukprot:TRINITY_DN14417_c0_g2_i1.p1 TRINITY_DN14417_c0_g2~~TRINITY_DN14417_c0_g2_i1.p1  ORF type:complete len:1017 (+),score=299.87 TRINITY_DN14417_c0_g2_i1:72-3122(+)
MLAGLVQEREVATAEKMKEMSDRLAKVEGILAEEFVNNAVKVIEKKNNETLEGVLRQIADRESSIVTALRNMKGQTDLYAQSLEVQQQMQNNIGILKEAQQDLHNEMTGKLAEDKLLGSVRVSMQHVVAEELLGIKDTLKKHTAKLTELEKRPPVTSSSVALSSGLEELVSFPLHQAQDAQITSLELKLDEMNALCLQHSEDLKALEAAQSAVEDRIAELPNKSNITALETTIDTLQAAHTQSNTELTTCLHDTLNSHQHLIDQLQEAIQTRAEADTQQAAINQQQESVNSKRDIISQQHEMKLADLNGKQDLLVKQNQEARETACAKQDNIAQQLEQRLGVLSDAVDDLKKVDADAKRLIFTLDDKFESLTQTTSLLTSANQANVENLTAMIVENDGRIHIRLGDEVRELQRTLVAMSDVMNEKLGPGTVDVIVDGVNRQMAAMQSSGSNTVSTLMQGVEAMTQAQDTLTQRLKGLEQSVADNQTSNMHTESKILQEMADRLSVLECNGSYAVDLNERLVVLEANSAYALPNLGAKLAELGPQLQAFDTDIANIHTKTTQRIASLQTELTSVSHHQAEMEDVVKGYSLRLASMNDALLDRPIDASAIEALQAELVAVSKRQLQIEDIVETKEPKVVAHLQEVVKQLTDKMQTMNDKLHAFVAEETSKSVNDVTKTLDTEMRELVGVTEKDFSKKLQENETRLREMLDDIRSDAQQTSSQVSDVQLKIEERSIIQHVKTSTPQAVPAQEVPYNTPVPVPIIMPVSSAPVFDPDTASPNPKQVLTPASGFMKSVSQSSMASPVPPDAPAWYTGFDVTPPSTPVQKTISPKRGRFSSSHRDKHDEWRREQVLRNALREKNAHSPFGQVVLNDSKRQYDKLKGALKETRAERRALEEKLASVCNSVAAMQQSFRDISQKQHSADNNAAVAKQLNSDLSPTSSYLRSEVDKVSTSISSVKQNIVHREKDLLEQTNSLRAKISALRARENELYEDCTRLQPLKGILHDRSVTPDYGRDLGI